MVFNRLKDVPLHDLAVKFTLKYHVPWKSDSPYYFGAGVGYHDCSYEWEQPADLN
jgi:hypothetical protein